MIKLLSHNTGPSYETLAQITLIKALNNKGLKAELYGESLWPGSQCAFKTLAQFKPAFGDIIINDGLKLQSYFSLINLGFTQYSHGRKKRVLNIAKFTLKFILNPIWVTRNLKLILYRRNSQQTSACLFKSDMTANNLIDLLSFKKESFNIEKNELTIFEDIKEANDIHTKITQSKATTVILAGAILEPHYFTKNIIPLINSRTKNVQYIGLNLDFTQSVVKSSQADAIVDLWIQKINS